MGSYQKSLGLFLGACAVGGEEMLQGCVPSLRLYRYGCTAASADGGFGFAAVC